MIHTRHYVGPAGPLHRAAYAYVLNLCPSDLAWEFLRRNAHYQRDYRLSLRGIPRRRRLRCGPILMRLRRRTHRSNRWGLDPFVDPKWPAPEAPLCWTIASAAPVLEGVAERATDGSRSALSIKDYAAARHIIIGPSGEEYILLRDGRGALTLRLAGARASLGPVDVTFLMSGFPDPRLAAQTFRALRDLTTSVRDRAGPLRARLFASDALLALDARQLGASYREIAAMIHGIEAQRAQWSGTSTAMKDRVRHLLVRGRQLSQGGYLKLLDGGGMAI
jgi:hypothetical protein